MDVNKRDMKFNGIWVDIYRDTKFTTSEGYLTDAAKTIMRANGLRTLDELLDFIPGFFSKGNMGREDVKVKENHVFDEEKAHLKKY